MTVGWDIGGAQLKAAVVAEGRVRSAAQWRCELWRGVERLDAALGEALRRWPEARGADHAVTMTGELVDAFAGRRAGVAAIADCVTRSLGERARCFAGVHGLVEVADARRRWRDVASANWLATAQWVAQAVPDALVVDVGSTTTDLVPIAAGRIVARGRDDATRLGERELVYTGVVRTPLCALGQRIAFAGRRYNVMNEWFATTGDVFRLTGELDPAHDAADTADHAGKDRRASRRRIARMIGRDAAGATAEAWRAFADSWRDLVVRAIRDNAMHVLGRLRRAQRAARPVTIVGAGCGAFLAREIAAGLGLDYVAFGDLVRAPARLRGWVDVCAPAVAVALAADRIRRSR